MSLDTTLASPRATDAEFEAASALQELRNQPHSAHNNGTRFLRRCERAEYIDKQQRCILFLRQCALCKQGQDECRFGATCKVGKKLWGHILDCGQSKCTYPRCTSSKDSLKHYQRCQNTTCPICVPVKECLPKKPAPRSPPKAAHSDT